MNCGSNRTRSSNFGNWKIYTPQNLHNSNTEICRFRPFFGPELPKALFQPFVSSRMSLSLELWLQKSPLVRSLAPEWHSRSNFRSRMDLSFELSLQNGPLVRTFAPEWPSRSNFRSRTGLSLKVWLQIEPLVRTFAPE